MFFSISLIDSLNTNKIISPYVWRNISVCICYSEKFSPDCFKFAMSAPKF